MATNYRSKIWITSDTHFGHTNMVKLCYRPENFDELIIKDWQEKVKPDDLVIHLGDVCWYPSIFFREVMPILPGKKILVRGNHDYKSLVYYMNHGFQLALDSMSMKYKGLDILFTHMPKVFHEHDINIHGHLHNNELTLSEPYSCYYLVSLEKNGYKMVDLETLMPKLTQQVMDFKDAQSNYLNNHV